MENHPSQLSRLFAWAKRNIVLIVVLIVTVAYLTLAHSGIARHYTGAVGRRISAENLPGILAAIAWPMAILSAVILLRHTLNRLLDRIEEIYWGDKGSRFYSDQLRKDVRVFSQETLARAEAETVNVVTTGPAVSRDMIGNVFWTGTDLTLASNILITGGDRRTILEVLRQGIHHMKASGMKGSPLQLRLQRIYEEIEKSLETDLTRERRADYAREIYASTREFGDKVIQLQQNFSGDPKTTDG